MKLFRVEYFIAGLINASPTDANRPANPLAWASPSITRLVRVHCAHVYSQVPVQFASRLEITLEMPQIFHY